MEKKESIPEMMHAWAVVKPGPIDGEQSPLQFVLKPVPKPKRGEVLVKVLACGVCHTDLHVSEGDLPVHQPNVTPGHEIVGQVVAFGEDTQRFKLGERIGIPWFRHACGSAASVARVAKIFAPIHATQAGITMAAMQSTLRYQKDLPIESPRVSMT
jgi:D-arabinose 1-dehydrogenase-like Zn-dependent alcohol dehydrogenase